MHATCVLLSFVDDWSVLSAEASVVGAVPVAVAEGVATVVLLLSIPRQVVVGYKT